MAFSLNSLVDDGRMECSGEVADAVPGASRLCGDADVPVRAGKIRAIVLAIVGTKRTERGCGSGEAYESEERKAHFDVDWVGCKRLETFERKRDILILLDGKTFSGTKQTYEHTP